VSAALPEGTVFADRYRIVRRIAMGGMGAVYEAVHLETGRRRALKVMHAHMFESEALRDRFKQEARIAAQIESEHIVDVSDAGVDEATEMPFMVMELLRGEELSKRLKRAGPLSPGETVSYLHQMALALDKTHAASIVHRDLKPENIFLCERDDGTVLVKILDFGVAKLVADGSQTAGATQSLGTPLYMAPEQFRSSLKLTPAADVYALGLLAFTMLVGRAYWKKEAREAGESIAFAFVAAQGPQEEPSVRAAELGVTLPAAFDAWFAKVTTIEPSERPTPATEVVRGLAEVFEVPLFTKNVSHTSLPGVAQGLTSVGSGVSQGATDDSEEPALLHEQTSTGASITHAPRKPGRGSLFAGIAALVAVALAAGAWLGRSSSSTAASGTAAPSATHATTSAKPANTDPVPTVSPVETAPAPPTAATALPTPSASAKAPPIPRAAAPAAPRPSPPAAAPATKPTQTLLGRD
jgi:serine/threonine-protein kinase